ncbi:single-stranded DNA-binding protein [Kitasatospora purpeofusca]|uniref:single-stranded DNA-binding protein n=1 Tax=Kitasatospora purpeofusca TaxID=67352 RepID=UPI002E0F6690|nr:single-stranded DNA-binding protein [Kitasatospora purpeofusca]WSR43310.1 single-stranded DNA-binding protein [Kitasatospora purpeofusca]
MNVSSHTTLIGRILRDPELYTPPGSRLPKVTFTVQQRPPLAGGGRTRGSADSSLTLRCIAWRGLAQQISELEAGTRVIVVGVLTQRLHTPKGESPRLVLELEVTALGVLLDGRERGQDGRVLSEIPGGPAAVLGQGGPAGSSPGPRPS